MERTWAEEARELSGLSPEACAVAIGRSRTVYDLREKEPGGLTLDQVAGLWITYNEEGRKALWRYLERFNPVGSQI
ncbi:hypothetical protein [Gordonibacter urolithinfaciens]|uniref:hypothetical protein n=1 Tax=Gordonibacter urolithinfaciens TaxID=1335613 RepID=UPI001D07F35D|nr:hypothetical protein [Gordonibacter urolithinfaciens]MCB7085757.1 hypothetical protein [Gordonibacter urolithinfaciens]